MKAFSVLLIAIGMCAVCPTSSHVLKKPNAKDDLIFAHTICRHGDRNSYQPYPKDEWRAESNWPGGFTELTNVGKQQHYLLGKYLRQRYAKLLGDGEYSRDKVFVYSTDTDRTLMSAESCLASLFPPTYSQRFNIKLDWQPIPVHTQPRHSDYIVAPEKPCDHYEYEMIKYTNSSEYKALFEQNSELIKHLEEKTNASMNTLTKLDFLYDTLFIEKLKGKRIPKWADEVMKPGSAFEYLSLYYFTIFTHSTDMKKLRSGYLLKEILDRSRNKTLSHLTPDRSLWMYFAHDNSIVDLLNSLGLYKYLHVPPYASCLLFDLYKSHDSNDHYLELYYRNATDTTKTPVRMEILNCGTSKCPLDKWYELYKDILPTQGYDDECKLRDGEEVLPNQNPEAFIL